MTERAVRAHVVGHVQQVGYRQSCRQVARSLGLVGWVRNLVDGRVEVFAQGEADNVDRLITWLWSGPAMAVVVGVESEIVAPDTTLRDFFIHPNPVKSN
jgi:acylphosphatase